MLQISYLNPFGSYPCALFHFPYTIFATRNSLSSIGSALFLKNGGWHGFLPILELALASRPPAVAGHPPLLSIPFPFFFLRTLWRNGHSTTPLCSSASALFLSQRRRRGSIGIYDQGAFAVSDSRGICCGIRA